MKAPYLILLAKQCFQNFRGPRKPSTTADTPSTAIPVAPTVDLDALENPADIDLPSPMVPETAAAASDMSGCKSESSFILRHPQLQVSSSSLNCIKTRISINLHQKSLN